ncbi:hypothetical protein IPdc08_01247 [archaeon]|nr:hypothetical protein IPdc08_01247 [archaeon]
MDETSPQVTANSQRLWSFSKSVVRENTTKVRANTFGFYAIHRKSLIDFKEKSKKEDVCEFLEKIREKNPHKSIIIMLNNFRSHWANKTRDTASRLGINLVFIPIYSPDLNPIEFIWKSIKREMSPLLIKTVDELKSIIEDCFYRFSKRLSFARRCVSEFLSS